MFFFKIALILNPNEITFDMTSSPYELHKFNTR